jgi:hypothetical protein
VNANEVDIRASVSIQSCGGTENDFPSSLFTSGSWVRQRIVSVQAVKHYSSQTVEHSKASSRVNTILLLFGFLFRRSDGQFLIKKVSNIFRCSERFSANEGHLTGRFMPVCRVLDHIVVTVITGHCQSELLQQWAEYIVRTYETMWAEIVGSLPATMTSDHTLSTTALDHTLATVMLVIG